jgi:hypothetical protein
VATSTLQQCKLCWEVGRDISSRIPHRLTFTRINVGLRNDPTWLIAFEEARGGSGSALGRLLPATPRMTVHVRACEIVVQGSGLGPSLPLWWFAGGEGDFQHGERMGGATVSCPEARHDVSRSGSAAGAGTGSRNMVSGA